MSKQVDGSAARISWTATLSKYRTYRTELTATGEEIREDGVTFPQGKHSSGHLTGPASLILLVCGSVKPNEASAA